jgi:hypothetical protein
MLEAFVLRAGLETSLSEYFLTPNKIDLFSTKLIIIGILKPLQNHDRTK